MAHRSPRTRQPHSTSRLSQKNGIKSDNFLQGQFGGVGYAIYKDQLGNSILEIDKLSVRKTFSVNELIINQVSAHGGIQIYSAASMTVLRVDEFEKRTGLCTWTLRLERF